MQLGLWGFSLRKRRLLQAAGWFLKRERDTLHLFPLLNEVGCLGVGQGFFLSLIWVILRLVSIPILS